MTEEDERDLAELKRKLITGEISAESPHPEANRIWTEEEKQRLRQVLGTIFGWDTKNTQTSHPVEQLSSTGISTMMPDNSTNVPIKSEDDPLVSSSVASPAPSFGLAIEQESKYTTDGYSLINRASGEAIPADEPVFIFRARDPYLLSVLTYYLAHVNDPAHQVAVERAIQRVQAWQTANPNKMKEEPDTQI